ncbi:MAG: ribonuclease HII [Campylobacter sp.]|uniref:ribonuclease HII n=1 Tax=Campylobacter sp. TaxID=205 RepID=UPI002AA841A5|nr:ribonuclease HII [Campylobacter sp.]MCI6694231.1 ribonuclease HII [Campylobacter sp.]
MFEDSLFGTEILGRICGIDEAGRGALAGELAVAGCAFGVSFSEFNLLDDSKKISEKKREEIFDIITRKCDYIVVYFRNTIIDELGLSACLARALRVIKAHFKDCSFIYDGNCSYGVRGISTLVKADSLVAQVSAASIIAKVSRDRSMRAWGQKYPEFGYEIHKGYGTKAHQDALAKYGANELTRKSFKLKANSRIP